jgi:hypothetical protein
MAIILFAEEGDMIQAYLREYCKNQSKLEMDDWKQYQNGLALTFAEINLFDIFCALRNPWRRYEFAPNRACKRHWLTEDLSDNLLALVLDSNAHIAIGKVEQQRMIWGGRNGCRRTRGKLLNACLRQLQRR